MEIENLAYPINDDGQDSSQEETINSMVEFVPIEETVLKSEPSLTRELWLRHAINLINTEIFNDNLPMKPYQVAIGWPRKNARKVLGEAYLTYVDEINPSNSYPATIHINVMMYDAVKIIEVLIHECIHAFYEVRGHGSSFRNHAKPIGFKSPYSKHTPSEELSLKCQIIHDELVKSLGELPHVAIKEIPRKPRPKKAPTSIKLYCNCCDFEAKAKVKMLKEYGLPTCVCGNIMQADLPE